MRVDAQPGAKTLAASTRIFALCDWHCKDNQICIMKVIEILNFNRELLKKLQDAGIRLEDCRYIDLYADYMKLLGHGEKAVSYTHLTLPTNSLV